MELAPGTQVYLLGQFVDFLKVAVRTDAAQILGYLRKDALGGPIPETSPLGIDDVPWEPIFDPGCSFGTYDAHNDTLTFTNDGPSLFSGQSSPIALDAPLQVFIEGLSVTGGGSDSSSVDIIGTPSLADPWFRGITRLSIGLDSGYYRLNFWDGTSEFPGDTILALDAKKSMRIRFDQLAGTSLTVFGEDGLDRDSVHLSSRPGLHLPNGLFPDGTIIIGLTLAPHSKFVIRGLRLETPPDGHRSGPATASPGLAELAEKRGLTFGTDLSVWYMLDKRYCETMQREFNVASLDEFSFPFTWLGPGKYDFRHMDLAVNYARQHGWRVRALHLVWGASEAIPTWLAESHYTREEYIDLLEEHVKTIVTRYKGRVQEWSIANEAIEREAMGPGYDFWNDKIGPEYIEMAFRWAREADPDGTLIFNGNGNDSPRDATSAWSIERTLEVVGGLKTQGVPIDVVGMQMHLFLPYMNRTSPGKESVVTTMRRFAELGVSIYITEMDVDLTRFAGTQAQLWEFQARVYGDVIDACLDSGVCHSFSTYGISDSGSWLTCDYTWCVHEPHAAPLLFDTAYNPKPAYFAVREALLHEHNPLSTSAAP